MPLQATSGAASYDAFGGGAAAVPNYIEECFSTTLYTGNGSTQTITNGIDLAGKGGLVWVKSRSTTYNNSLVDSARGLNRVLVTNSTAAQGTMAALTFNSNGFTLPNDTDMNGTGQTFASWTFREQSKFFDVVTYTGNGTSGRTIAHNLGSTPGFIIVKRTDVPGDWMCYHRSITFTGLIRLNLTNATLATSAIWVQNPTSTVFTVGSNTDVNESGGTYVAYLFAHNAGGFGLTGTDNVISCGSFTTDGSASATVNLGWEPQWVLIKSADQSDSWFILDNMRGWVTGGNDARLLPNSSNAEATGSNYGNITATGFVADGAYYANSNHIYIAIRRGPMKVPTTGTSVFAPSIANGATRPGFVTDLQLANIRAGDTFNTQTVDRLRGGTLGSVTSSTAAEYTGGNQGFDTNNGTNYSLWTSGAVRYMFQRAPNFFDEVCYTGNGSTQTITHNLGVAPELIIAKNRGQAGNNWPVLFNFASTTMNYGFLNLTNSCPNDTYANAGVFSAAPTATTFSLVNSSSMNGSGFGIVAYLFASCPGVSKVGSYTGNGSSQTINCGFTGGARFVLIKATSTTGNWLVWDSARGIVSGNDPYLALNSTAAEVTNTDWVDTASSGFELSNDGGNLANSNGVTYIFLAIA